MSCFSNHYLEIFTKQDFSRVGYFTSEHKMNKIGKKIFLRLQVFTFELCWMGLGFGHVQLRKLQSFRWLDDVPLLGATIQRATITTVFCASPPPSICCIRPFIHSKKEEKERSSFARVFFTTYGVFGFKGQHFCFNQITMKLAFSSYGKNKSFQTVTSAPILSECD